MTQDEIIELARQSGFDTDMQVFKDGTAIAIKLAKLVAEKEREVVANWIMDRGFATGHGDSIVDLLDQLEWQIAEKEREACAKICDLALLQNQEAINELKYDEYIAECIIQGAMTQSVKTSKSIRARGET